MEDNNNNIFENRNNDMPVEQQPAASEPQCAPQPAEQPVEQYAEQPQARQNEVQYTASATPVMHTYSQPVRSEPAVQPQNPQQSSYAWTDSTPPKKKNGGKIFGFIILAVLATAILTLAVYGGIGVYRNATANRGNSSSLPDSSSAGIPSSAQDDVEQKTGFDLETREDSEALTPSEIAAKVRPSVVGVVNYSINSLTPSGYGSGVIINAEGYIVTNYHVIKGADRVKIVLDNQKEVLAKIIGYDEQTDLAVLKVIEDENVKCSDLTYASFGDSDQIQLAETVIAIGNPGGLEFAGTVTRGIVSGTNVKTDSAGTVGFIQTDAAINPGNSGGPLIDSYGNVIGITSEKIVATEYEGMGFAIPSNVVKPIVDSIITYGYVPGRPLLGISGSDIDEYVAYFNQVPQGVLITAINADSDLVAKGVMKNDIITEFNGVTVKTMEQLNTEKEKCKAGDTIQLKIYRYSEGREFTVSVVLSEYKPH